MSTVVAPPFVNYLGHVPVVGKRNANKIVWHVTEGWGNVESLGDYFESTKHAPEGSGRHNLGIPYAVEPSGRMGRYCHVDDLVQHVVAHNHECTGIEQIGFTTTNTHDWETKFIWQIRGTAWITAWLSERLGIPLRWCAHNHVWLYPSGVAQHMDLPDNDHDDCGKNYPASLVMHKAIHVRNYGVPAVWRSHLGALARA